NQSDSKLLADLRVTDPRDDKRRIERRKGGLLRDSYYWVLDHEAFVRWQTDTRSSLLWIRGDPGKGKTMLICGIIDELPAHMPGWDTTYFFCEATDSRLNNATAVLRSLLYLLLRKRPSLSRFIREEHEDAGKQLFEDANGWDVLYGSFMNIVQDGGLNDFIIIIDALDECKVGLYQLLDFIVRLSLLNVKVIASSRNWLIIEGAIAEVSGQVCIKLELNEALISSAVKEYISHKVDQLVLRKKYDINTRNYVYNRPSSKANDTFLWVALVTDQLGKPGVSERHALRILEELPRELNSLYERMLERTWESNDRDICRRILAVVSVVYRPVTLLELMSLAELEEFRTKTEMLETIVGECGSLLTVKDGIVYFVHQSAKEFLSGHALAEVMPSGIRHEHKLLLSRSLEVMSKTCRRNIYDLKAPGASLDDIRTPVPDPLGPAKYACVYWLEHVNDGGHMDKQQYSQVYDFLKQHFLHWIEALSLLKSVSSGIAGLFKLARATQPLDKSEPRLFIQDALRFTRYFRVAIENWPLQLYSSALIFSPTESIIRKQFQNEIAKWIIKQPAVENQWTHLLHTLDGHKSLVTTLAIAPDGATLASASFDETVRLWDTITVECLRTLQSHRGPVQSVAFSPKGDKLASASTDGTAELWDKATGRLLNTFHRAPSMYTCLRVAFFGGDQQVALGSQKCVQIWDAATGQRTREFMYQGFDTGLPDGLAFSDDGALFALCPDTGQVVLFDTETGQILKTLDSQRSSCDCAEALAFSCDGTRLITSSQKSGLTLWDTTTSQSIWTDKDGFAEELACSRDGGLIACSTFTTQTVEIRDGVTGKVLQILLLVDTLALAFSLDGTHLFSGSWDGMISVWDLTRLQRHQLNEPNMLAPDVPSTAIYSSSHRNPIIAVAFSNNGEQLAFLSRYKLAIWDFTTGQCLKTSSIDIHRLSRLSVLSMSYSRSGILLANENTRSITIWDAATSLRLNEFGKNGETRTMSACFSKDGATLAVSSLDETIKLWDVATGGCKVTFTVRVQVYCLRFSESGSQLITPDGIINLESLSSMGAEMSTPQILEMKNSNSQGLMLSEEIERAWIRNNSKPILWIPPGQSRRIRSWIFDVRGSAIVLGSDSGRILMMEFSSDFSVM
ncbi:hypothetical protein K456DRAFT_1911675, partial [Colletotrichum gloeosporioides 23]